MRRLILLVALAGCHGGQGIGPIDLTAVHFHLFSPNMGVYPDQSVLSDPNNPFANDAPNTNCTADLALLCQAHWDIQAQVAPPDYALAPAAFYSWATLLANAPSGEEQFYAALNLGTMYQTKLVGDCDLEPLRLLAIRAYQAVLDSFPTSVTYDANGVPQSLALWSTDNQTVLKGMTTQASCPDMGQ
jgi:hypothetical protein